MSKKSRINYLRSQRKLEKRINKLQMVHGLTRAAALAIASRYHAVEKKPAIADVGDQGMDEDGSHKYAYLHKYALQRNAGNETEIQESSAPSIKLETGSGPEKAVSRRHSVSPTDKLYIETSQDSRRPVFGCHFTRCNFAGTDAEALSTHIRTHLYRPRGENYFHKCDVCSASFLRLDELAIHWRTHDGAKLLVCDSPGCGYYTVETWKFCYHQGGHVKPDGSNIFVCSIGSCSSSFVTTKGLARHVRLDHASDGCTPPFVIANDLSTDVRLDHNSGGYTPIFVVNNSFATPAGLDHNFESSIPAFVTSNDLTAPVMLDLSSRGVYECDHAGCDASFSRLDHLAKHKQSHDQLLKCCFRGCGYTTTHISELGIHHATHAPIRPGPIPA